MIATILTYLSLAYSFDLAYENTEWMLWDYDTSITWYTRGDRYIGFTPDVEFRAGTDKLYGFIGGNVYGSARVEGLSPGGFDPVLSDYQFRVGFKYMSTTIGYEYHCVHPIQTYITDERYLQWQKEGSYSKFYITVSGTIGGRKK